MNLESLRQKLLSAAQANPPGDHVPYAFEKRILARLNERPAPELAALWSRALWRAAMACVVVTVALGAWSYVGSGLRENGVTAVTTVTTDSEDFSQQFEQTMLAAVDEQTEEVW